MCRGFLRFCWLPLAACHGFLAIELGVNLGNFTLLFLEGILAQCFSTTKNVEECCCWNKACLEYCLGDSELSIRYRKDKDLAWLMGLSGDSNQKQVKLDQATEFAILGWEGLPASYERSWSS